LSKSSERSNEDKSTTRRRRFCEIGPHTRIITLPPLYIRNPKLDELLPFRVLKELSHALSDAFDCLRRKPPLHIHVLTESIDFLLVRREANLVF
jgi:hypothetical protein